MERIFFRKVAKLLIASLFVLLASACASDGTDYSNDGEPDSGSRAHPAAYLVESFPVNRKHERRPANTGAEFYFKSCSRGGEKWPYSRTSYDCDYPF